MARKAGTNKAKGNSFEREIAAILSHWIFGDKYVLGRDPTSGARGTVLGAGKVYAGDIVPVKQLPESVFTPSKFPFLLELKVGYKKDIPTIFQQRIVHKWVKKLISELTDEQKSPILILRFHYQQTIMVMPFELKSIPWEMCFNVPVIRLGYLKFYTYSFDSILQFDFKTIYSEMNK